jgi:hypothetical protein
LETVVLLYCILARPVLLTPDCDKGRAWYSALRRRQLRPGGDENATTAATWEENDPQQGPATPNYTDQMRLQCGCWETQRASAK